MLRVVLALQVLFWQVAKKSFRTYLLANREANHVGAMPVLYRPASLPRRPAGPVPPWLLAVGVVALGAGLAPRRRRRAGVATACTYACLIECVVPLPGEGRRIKPSVLVIDDDPSTTAFLEAALEDVGYDVQTAVHGDVLPLAHDQPPAAIPLGPMMPPMDGIEVSRRLRADHVTAGIPSIAMSAAQRLAAMAGRMVVDVQVPKPFDLPTLYATVARR